MEVRWRVRRCKGKVDDVFWIEVICIGRQGFVKSSEHGQRPIAFSLRYPKKHQQRALQSSRL